MIGPSVVERQEAQKRVVWLFGTRDPRQIINDGFICGKSSGRSCSFGLGEYPKCQSFRLTGPRERGVQGRSGIVTTGAETRMLTRIGSYTGE